MKTAFLTLVFLMLAVTGLVAQETATKEPVSAPKPQATSPVKIKPSQLIVRPKTGVAAPDFSADPRGWIEAKQRVFYDKMSKALQSLRANGDYKAGFLLIFLSFVYGVLHAAGPGHGKAVVSAWLLANEQQLRRGILIAAMAAFIQALTAVVIVSGVLLFVRAAGTKARFIASSLEAISFGMIALVGAYLIWRTLKEVFKDNHAHAHAHHAHAHDAHGHHSHSHPHAHDETCPTSLSAAAACDCGHAHMPSAVEVSKDWSLTKAFSLAFAVGIRPCSGAILVLLLSSTLGLYWVGVVSAFAMAVGTGITVSLVAVLTVFSKNLAVRLTGENNPWLAKGLFIAKLLAGIFIMLTGAFLFWATLPRVF